MPAPVLTATWQGRCPHQGPVHSPGTTRVLAAGAPILTVSTPFAVSCVGGVPLHVVPAGQMHVFKVGGRCTIVSTSPSARVMAAGAPVLTATSGVLTAPGMAPVTPLGAPNPRVMAS